MLFFSSALIAVKKELWVKDVGVSTNKISGLCWSEEEQLVVSSSIRRTKRAGELASRVLRKNKEN